jgi:hypothetical protein
MDHETVQLSDAVTAIMVMETGMHSLCLIDEELAFECDQQRNHEIQLILLRKIGFKCDSSPPYAPLNMDSSIANSIEDQDTYFESIETNDHTSDSYGNFESNLRISSSIQSDFENPFGDGEDLVMPSLGTSLNPPANSILAEDRSVDEEEFLFGDESQISLNRPSLERFRFNKQAKT